MLKVGILMRTANSVSAIVAERIRVAKAADTEACRVTAARLAREAASKREKKAKR